MTGPCGGFVSLIERAIGLDGQAQPAGVQLDRQTEGIFAGCGGVGQLLCLVGGRENHYENGRKSPIIFLTSPVLGQ